MNACPTCLSESVQRALTLTPELASSAESYSDDLGSLTSKLHTRLTDFETRLTEVTSNIINADSDDAIAAHCRHDENFPASFATHRPDVAVVYVFGSAELFAALNKRQTVALVGARRASAYGREVSYSFANDAASHGLLVITTMSLGVPGAANRGALQATGETIAFLAGPADEAYPRSHRLLHEQITQKGCAISVVPPGLNVGRAAFELRSELIGDLAGTSVFVEGSIESGAMHTIDEARRVGNIIGAVPGPVTGPLSDGPNSLLARDAQVVCSATDLFEENAAEPRPTPIADLRDDDRDVLAAITHGHNTLRQIAAELPALAPRDISAALGRLELLGHVERSEDAYRAS